MVKFVNRAKMQISTTGNVSSITMSNTPPDGFQTFQSAGIVTGDTISYTIESGDTAFEVGTGTVTISGGVTTLSRDTVLTGSLGAGNRINVGNSVAGTESFVFVTSTAEDMTNASTPVITTAISSPQSAEVLAWNGTAWANATQFSGTTVSANAPASPQEGDIWVDEATLKNYIYYTDQSGDNYWIETLPVGPTGPTGSQGSTGEAGTSASVVANQTAMNALTGINAGHLAYVTADKAMFSYDGTAWTRFAYSADNNAAGVSRVVANMAALIAVTGMNTGDIALVNDLKKLFMYTGVGWYVIATITNDSPSAISGVNATYTLSQDATPTVITAIATDPEGFPLTWSYSVSAGSLGSIATVSQSDNVFTITPSTTDAGTFSLTFSATDNINGAVSASSAFTLAFISWAVPTLSQEIATSNTSGAYRPFFGGGTDISNEGTAVIGHRQGFTNGYGGIRIVKLSGSTWSVEQDIENYIDSSLNSNYQYYLGDCVSISNDGNTVVASNTSNGNLNYVYTRSGSTWSFQQVIGNDSSTYNTQLERMNINAISGDGNTIALGSNPRGSNSGTTVDKVYVYKRTGTTWAAETISVPTEVSNQGGGAAFGRWVSLSSDGNKLATGSSGLDVGATNAGGAWIANRSGSTWSWESKIHFGTPASNANCGFGQLGNMSSDGNYLLAGNLGANQEAYVFYWDGSSWNLQATISGTNPSTYTETLGPGGAGSFDSSGSVLALQGRQQAAWSTNMVGTFQADIIIYKRTGTSWSYLGYIRTPLSSDFFGFNSSCATLSRNSEYMIFGNPEAPDQNGNTGGRAYIYKRGS
ncbi:MAG: hypothetical protein CMF96_03190 [Candidatus Marinimicrobia bacterium]|nr:hypothetical protein [Candidatus Neomarinimicrobiota bacterium]